MAGAELTRVESAAIISGLRDRASAATRGRVTNRDFSLCGKAFRVRLASEQLLDPVCRPLERLAAEPGRDPQLRISVWSDATLPVPAGLPPGARVRASDDEWSFAECEAQSVTGFDAQAGEGWCWVCEGAPFPNEAAPLGGILWAWLAAGGAALAHGSAVGNATGAVLLAGPFAAGKTTAMTAGLSAGLKCVADDVCVLAERDGTMTVAGIFGSVQTGPRIGEKTTDLLPADQLLADAPLRAVAVLERSGAARPALAPITGAAALAALAPASMLWSPGPREATFSSLARAIDGVPCFAFDPGPAPAETAAAIRSLL